MLPDIGIIQNLKKNLININCEQNVNYITYMITMNQHANFSRIQKQ